MDGPLPSEVVSLPHPGLAAGFGKALSVGGGGGSLDRRADEVAMEDLLEMLGGEGGGVARGSREEGEKAARKQVHSASERGVSASSLAGLPSDLFGWRGAGSGAGRTPSHQSLQRGGGRGKDSKGIVTRKDGAPPPVLGRWDLRGLQAPPLHHPAIFTASIHARRHWAAFYPLPPSLLPHRLL